MTEFATLAIEDCWDETVAYSVGVPWTMGWDLVLWTVASNPSDFIQAYWHRQEKHVTATGAVICPHDIGDTP